MCTNVYIKDDTDISQDIQVHTHTHTPVFEHIPIPIYVGLYKLTHIHLFKSEAGIYKIDCMKCPKIYI